MRQAGAVGPLTPDGVALVDAGADARKSRCAGPSGGSP